MANLKGQTLYARQKSYTPLFFSPQELGDHRNPFFQFVGRFFDILKPPPVSTPEVLPGGFGIMADDIVAGALAGFSLLVLSFFSGTPFI